jgi:Fe-S-cluster containining protein
MTIDNSMSVRVPADPCAPCGLCCRSYLVPVFGHDLYRLVTRQNIDPRQFVFFCEQEEPDRVGFRLKTGGTSYGLALTKKHKLEATQPCTFLVEHDDGGSRCGVYEHRPIACSTYPMSRTPTGIALSSTALCPPGSWADDEAARPSWAAGLHRLSRYRDTYVEVINRWNAWVDINEDERPSQHFIAYVLQVYDRLAKLDDELGADTISEIERTWASFPPGSPAAGSKAAEPMWLTYLRRARAVIDGFFPTLPPLPFARIVLDVEPGAGSAQRDT